MQNLGDSNHAHTEDVTLKDLNSETITEIFDRAKADGSNPDLLIHEVEWHYWINPASLVMGAARLNYNTKYEGLVTRITWPVEDEDYDKTGCGIIAFMIGYIRKEKIPNIWKDMRLGKITKRVEGKRQVLTSGKKVTYFDNPHVRSFTKELIGQVFPEKNMLELVFSDFSLLVEHFKTFRICILRDCTLSNLYTTYTGDEYVFNEDSFKDKTIYIFHDSKFNHYVYCSSPLELYKSIKGNNRYKWCHRCVSISKWNKITTCMCGTIVNSSALKPIPRVICEYCGLSHSKYAKHKCHHLECRFCRKFFKAEDNGANPHRCPIIVSPKQFKQKFIGQELHEEEEEVDHIIDDEAVEEKEEEKYNLYSFDLESCIYATEDETIQYETEDDGVFRKDEHGNIKTYVIEKSEQVPNFVAWKNIFTGEKFMSHDLNFFIDFILTSNGGRNMMIAHNASGYDTRLLFELIIKSVGKNVKIEPILRGGKFMRLKVGATIFQDSMLHLRGRLSDLAKGFKLNMKKGYFPHLFNKKENYEYIGRLPDKKYFDMTFIVRNKEEFDEFNKWHDEYEGEWNFNKELEDYCVSDVDILSEIVLKYHVELTGLIRVKYPELTVSPWFFPTMAGHVHKIILKNLHANMDILSMGNEEYDKYVQSTWTMLDPSEYYFARLALRGGRTDIRQYYYKGVIHYKDVQSHYPHVQLSCEYPVGTPLIEVFDPKQWPCSRCHSTIEQCKHSIPDRMSSQSKKLTIVNRVLYDGSLNEYVKNFFGILMVDVTPPKKLYHPVLVTFDEVKKKCIATLEKIVKGTFTSVELSRAIDMGYEVTKIYRADRYNKAPSLWRGLLGDLYLGKMKNSGKAPDDEEERNRMRKRFREKFGIDLGDMDKWEKNAILKQIAKGPPTAAWGKHAETVDHGQTAIFGSEMSGENKNFYEDIVYNGTKIDQFISFENDTTLFKYTPSRKVVKPDLSRGYLPIAVFVTSYARLYLWEEMNKLGTRVLMHDTDSIIYTDEGGDYDIEEGDCLGDWETEDFEKDNGGIAEFVAIGPKSYGLKGGNGKEFFKCKGVSIKYCHSELINFEIAKSILMEKKIIKIPQMTFDYALGKGMYTRKYMKLVQFHKKDVKGDYNENDYRNYPYGY